MTPRGGRRLIYIALVLAFLLRHDFWQWSNPTLIAGLPVGLLYHVLFCFGVALLMAILVRFAWPEWLSVKGSRNNS